MPAWGAASILIVCALAVVHALYTARDEFRRP